VSISAAVVGETHSLNRKLQEREKSAQSGTVRAFDSQREVLRRFLDVKSISQPVWPPLLRVRSKERWWHVAQHATPDLQIKESVCGHCGDKMHA